MQGYAYHRNAGRGITSFVIDSGFNSQSAYRDEIHGGLDWLISDENYWHQCFGGELGTFADKKDHGTAVISRLATTRFGVCPLVHITMVKTPWPALSYFLVALSLIKGEVSATQKVCFLRHCFGFFHDDERHLYNLF